MDEEITQNHLFIAIRHEFQATRVIGQRLSPTRIKLKLDISTLEDDTEEYSTRMEIALAKIEFWIRKIADKCVIIDALNDWAMDAFMANNQPHTDNNILLAPEDATDALLCELLFCKFKALAQGAFEFHAIDIESSDARGMSFLFVGQSPGEDFPSNEDWLGERNYFSRPWWDRDDASSIDISPEEEDNLEITPKWAYSLGFIADQMANGEESPPKNIVVRAEFRPKIIEGGKVD